MIWKMEASDNVGRTGISGPCFEPGATMVTPPQCYVPGNVW